MANKIDNTQRTQSSDHTFEPLVGKYDHKAGIAQRCGSAKLSPYDLRRTFARQSYDNGSTLIQVQITLGHSDPNATSG